MIWKVGQRADRGGDDVEEEEEWYEAILLPVCCCVLEEEEEKITRKNLRKKEKKINNNNKACTINAFWQKKFEFKTLSLHFQIPVSDVLPPIYWCVVALLCFAPEALTLGSACLLAT